MTMRIISIDAETDGLYGDAFAIAGTVHNLNGEELTEHRFLGRCGNLHVTNEWVKENVLPTLGNVRVTHDTPNDLLRDFAKWWVENKADSTVICHMGTPVEAGLFIRAHAQGFIGDFDGPYPLIDIAGNLQQVGEDPTSVDDYAKKHELSLPDGNPHNPLYDCQVAVLVYGHLKHGTKPVCNDCGKPLSKMGSGSRYAPAGCYDCTK